MDEAELERKWMSWAVRVLFQVVLLGLIVANILFELIVLISLMDYLGQYVVPYDPELYLGLMAATVATSLLLNHLFLRIQKEVSIRTLAFFAIAALLHSLKLLLEMWVGAWMFGYYPYDHLMFWGMVIANLYIIIMYVVKIKRLIAQL